jgi:hypothetical protein
VTLKTLHGAFKFEVQKYQFEGISLSYLELTQPESCPHLGRGLQEFCAYYSNRLSYQEVAALVERHCGARVLSSQAIWQLVQHQALRLSEMIERTTLGNQNDAAVKVTSEIDLYDSRCAEVLLFDDAIGVKAQKPERPRSPVCAVEGSEHAKTVSTDVVMLQTAPQQFEYLSAPIAADGTVRLSIEAVVQARIHQVYDKATAPLPLVVISDGATLIRQRWNRTFGSAVVVILDWYHLCEKFRQLMSMIARTKDEKTSHLKALLSELWHGRTQAALDYLQSQVIPPNREKWQELITYLEKHRQEIVDYERRRQVGKSIGSGRVEKAVDQVIGYRQKRKGKSWRPQGSRALGLLKVLELNGRWQAFWFSESAII